MILKNKIILYSFTHILITAKNILKTYKNDQNVPNMMDVITNKKQKNQELHYLSI